MAVGVQLLLVTFLCLALGASTSMFYLKKRSRKHRVTWLDGLLSWLLFIFTSFLANALCMPLLKGVGDNPAAAAGGAVAFILSFILNPIFWFWFR